MKMQFGNYDDLKQKFYSEIIEDLEFNNENQLDRYEYNLLRLIGFFV